MFDLFSNPKPKINREPLWKYEPSGWQICPLYKRSKSNHSDDCTVCKGKKIINKLTGKPPKEE